MRPRPDHIATRVAAERVRVTVLLAEQGIVRPDVAGHAIRDLERLGIPTPLAVDLVRQGQEVGSRAAYEAARIAADLERRGVA